MAKFCSWCGAPLEPGARYCPECGARVLESVTLDGSADAVDPLRGLDIVDGTPVPADATAKLDRSNPMDTDTLVLPTDNAQKRFGLEGVEKKGKGPLVAMCAVIAVLLVAVVALAYANLQAQNSTPGEPVPVTHNDSGDAQRKEESKPAEPAATKPATEPEDEALSDDEIFKELDAAYGRLSGYGDDIAACVEEFNNLFLARSLDDRKAAMERAVEVLGDIQVEIEAIEELDVPGSSTYAEDAANVAELYGCQAGRVSSLVDAWTLDVTFEVPSEHKDEILAVLSQSNENGTNKYLTRFDELYPQAKPEKA